MVAEFLNCSVISDEAVNCSGSIFDLPEKRLTYRDEEFWIYLGVYVGLVLIAGLMSGLTMGLLSLDPTTLAVLRDGGTEREQRHAKRILPLVSRHHLLLVTLLLANAAAVEAMPIFLDRISDPVIAIVTSVTAVLIFGEVIPQAICTRFGLAIGAVLSPAGSTDGEKDDDYLTIDEVLIIKGALDMKYKTARDAMVPISEVFMLSIDDRLNSETMTQIMTRGHSRIPVYGGDRSNVIALLLTKTLIKLDPDDNISIKDIVSSRIYARPAMFVDDTLPLFDLLNQFQTGKNHLAMVRKNRPPQPASSGAAASDYQSDTEPLLKIEDEPYEESEAQELVGVIALEDVIEELLQEEISDETDVQNLQEMGGMLQVAMAKAVNRHR
ncbi:hypothetical protein BaRGS_00005632, partial [Batillaria attramentaria]